MVTHSIPLLLNPSSPSPIPPHCHSLPSIRLGQVQMSLRLNWIEFPQHFPAIPGCPLIAKRNSLLFTPRRNQCTSVSNAVKSACKVLNLPYSSPLIIGLSHSSESEKSNRRPGLISAALPCPCWESLQPHGLLNNTRHPPLLPVAFNGGCFVQGVSVYLFF